MMHNFFGADSLQSDTTIFSHILAKKQTSLTFNWLIVVMLMFSCLTVDCDSKNATMNCVVYLVEFSNDV